MKRAVLALADGTLFEGRSFGASAETAQTAHLAEITGLLDALAGDGGAQCYVEILAKPGHRTRRPADAAADEAEPAG